MDGNAFFAFVLQSPVVVEFSVLVYEAREVLPDGTSKIGRDRINWSV
jgi:hypothetical protein